MAQGRRSVTLVNAALYSWQSSARSLVVASHQQPLFFATYRLKMEEKSAYTYKQAPRPIRPEGSIAPYSNPMYKVRAPPQPTTCSTPSSRSRASRISLIFAFLSPLSQGDPPYTGAWADCAYDPETPGVMHHPDQIRVPTEIDAVLRLYTKAAVREQVEAADLVTWSRDWFDKKKLEREAEALAAAEASK